MGSVRVAVVAGALDRVAGHGLAGGRSDDRASEAIVAVPVAKMELGDTPLKVSGGSAARRRSVLHLTGRVSLALLLAAFFVVYAILGLLLTPLVGLVLGAMAVPGRLRAMGQVLRAPAQLASERAAVRPTPGAEPDRDEEVDRRGPAADTAAHAMYVVKGSSPA